MSENLTTYTPDQRRRTGFFTLWGVMFKNIIKSRELIWQLFKRDFLMAYRKSFLGMAWIFIAPLVGIVSWVFMNMTGILNPGEMEIPYPAFVLISTSIWGLFMGFYESATETLGSGTGFIMQVKYPHEALLVKQTAQLLANFLLGFALNLVVLVAFGITPSWKTVFIPFAILPLFLLGGGIGLIFSVIKIVAIDITKGFTIVFGLLMYITPVIYSDQVESATLRMVMKYNPLTYLVGNVRDLIIFGRFDHPDRFLYASLFALLVFLISWRFFYLSEEKVIEKMF